jgi:TldD protein
MEDLAESTIAHAVKLGAEFSDLRIESSTGTNVVVMDGKTKSLTAMRESGCGVRAFMGGAWGFAVTNSLTKQALRDAAASAVGMAKVARSKAKTKFQITDVKMVRATEVYPCRERPSDVPMEEKVGFAMSLDRSMSSKDSRISSTNVKYDDVETDRVVANSFGTLVRSREVWGIGACSAFARSEGIVQHGHAASGSVGGYELMRTDEAVGLGDEAASQALRLLESKPVPAGNFTVVLDSKMCGLLAHEAFGHACEADAIISSSSVLEGRVGKKVADERISLIDDPTIENTFGYFSYDWEGVKAKRHVLIERGVLKGFMNNIETSSRMGVAPNGSSRAETYSATPIIRMSNTFIGKGDMKRDEMIKDLKEGLLIQGAQYGYVEPAKGQFMFKCDEAHGIKNGEVGERYRDASISGLILEVLNNVVAVGKDFVLGDPGYCGKGGQSARTTDGGPHLCVSNMVVGGLA